MRQNHFRGAPKRRLGPLGSLQDTDKSTFASLIPRSCVLLLAIGQSQPLRYDEPTPVTGGWWLMQQPSGHAGVESTLAALKEKGASQSRPSEQLAHAMMRLADTDRQPRWPLVVIFDDNLTRDLLGNQLTTAQNTALRECLSEATRPTGTSNARLATRLQEILAAAGVKPWKLQPIIDEFIKLRESVQGPDDIPVRLTIPIPH